MNFTEEQVEWIVLEVIRRLRRTHVATDQSNSSPASELILADRVVTMRSLEGRLVGITRIVVKRRAVVTPAVKDELKDRKIELVFEERER